jgi:hypothetical protein
MIANDEELQGTRTRIAYFEDLLGQMRVTARPELFLSMASGYRSEIEKMQREVLEYLTRHVSQPLPVEASQAHDHGSNGDILSCFAEKCMRARRVGRSQLSSLLGQVHNQLDTGWRKEHLPQLRD